MNSSPAPNWSASQLLYDKGAISLNDLQIAQDTEDKAKVDVKTTAEKLRVLGSANLDQSHLELSRFVPRYRVSSPTSR